MNSLELSCGMEYWSGVSGVARILMKGVLKVNGHLAGYRGWGREGDVLPPAEGGSFGLFQYCNWCSLLILKYTA